MEETLEGGRGPPRAVAPLERERERVELRYDVTKGTGYFMSLYTSVVATEEYNVKSSNEELVRFTEYLTQ
jgi:hypothetical protein